MTEDDIHDQLVQAYLEYFKANEIWERKKSVRTYFKVQQNIRKVRDIADARNKEIREIQKAKKEAK
jgi:hypothetical protein